MTFPLDLFGRSGEKIFIGVGVNPIWLPNHVTYDVIRVNLLFLMDRWSYVKFRLDLCSHFREEDF